MATSFLDVINKSRTGYDGDQFGGADGSNGQGLPTGSLSTFMFATGMECSNPVTKDGRRDQLLETRHYELWEKDLHLVRSLGIKVLRYGLPYYKINTARGKYDWSFADLVMNRMKSLGITPILDLMHFGLPDWIGNYQNPELPVLFAEYVEEVAKRYPWVRYFTPVNEIYVTAKFSGREGVWNEQLKSDRAFVTCLKHCVAASILACQAITRHRPDAIVVQSESAEFTHSLSATFDIDVDRTNRLRFLSLDLLYGKTPDADILLFCLDNGLTREEYDWFMRGEPPGYQVMGNDYYGRNEWMKLPDGRIVQAKGVLGWYTITHEYWQRYKKPVMHTETNTFDPNANGVYLWKQFCNILKMRDSGIPVLGFTWYSLLDQYDWDIGLSEKKMNVNPVGLFDLDRNPRPVAAEYRTLLEEFGQIKIVPHGEMFDITRDPAMLKMDR